MVEAKARRGNDDLDDVFVATSRRTARDRAWGVIFGIGALLVSRIIFVCIIFFFFRVSNSCASRGRLRLDEIGFIFSLSLFLIITTRLSSALFFAMKKKKTRSAPLDALNRGNQLHRVRRRAEERRPDAIGDGVWPSVFGPFIPSKVGSE